MGDPFGAISCGVETSEFGALPWVGDVGVARLPRPPPLPSPRGMELRFPRLALNSKLTIRFWGKLGVVVSLCHCAYSKC